MTSQSPRIYIYKITFEEVPYYYYGVHKERKYDEYYMGTPITHKWVWNFYTPKKQILELFEYNNEGYITAQETEKRIIKPFYNIDKWCLNENCGGALSIDKCRQNGKIIGQKSKENGTGIFSLTKEERIINSKKAGQISGQKAKENKTGICGLSKEERIKYGEKGGKISGQKHKENKTGVCGRSREDMQKHGKKWGPIIGKLGGKSTSSQIWKCTITGHKSTPGGLTSYQRARNIDTSNRIRIL